VARNTSFTLSDHFIEFINEQVASGRYGSASEVVREGLRLVEAREQELDVLRRLLIEGEESGAASPLDVDQFLAEMHEQQR
jgi:antitoxin ParD1/3/4